MTKKEGSEVKEDLFTFDFSWVMMMVMEDYVQRLFSY